MNLLVNIDVPDLSRAIAFYTEAFGVTVTRRIGDDSVELGGGPVPIYLLERGEGSTGAARDKRRYARHWTPVHLDLVVEDIDAALARAVSAGASKETEISVQAWGKIATLSDPFGHGVCLIQFLNRGYDEIATPYRVNS